MNLGSLVGQTLDSKYKIERELGRGGMGAVYFATHIGTERPIALKVIVPQFMQKAEFVERFRREARAAGRLRHPNVVDVTDFGFAETPQGRVAYLVMEYLDGCTLGEILEEEKQLPLSFTLDIVEQVCSAINEAHEQGIIHRDLKPDNIWLEPNQRGGYTVKVLDFGIAKLEEDLPNISQTNLQISDKNQTQLSENKETVSDITQTNTIFDNQVGTLNFESKTAILSEEKGTLIQNDEIVSEKGTAILQLNELNLDEKVVDASEQGTAVFADKKTQIVEKEDGTKLLSKVENTDENELSKKSTAELTRVGAVLGTPLYMSPEQCRGEKLTTHSDIYSLAVIVYQMLGGGTPFSGDWTTVMNSHKEVAPPPLVAKKVPRKVKQVIHSALSKNIDERPPTAEAFASELRSHSEGFGRLLQKALVLYSENLPKFIGLAVLAATPHIVSSIIQTFLGILASTEIIEPNTSTTLNGIISFIGFFAQIFVSALVVGTVTWIIAQMLAVPLRPISVRAGLKEAWSKVKPLFFTVTPQTLLTLVTITCCFPLGFYFSTIYSLVAPSIMMENIRGKAAFKRSKELTKRSFWTALAVSLLIYFVPIIIGGTVGGVTFAITEQLDVYDKLEKGETKISKDEKGNENFDINIGTDGIKLKEKDQKNLSPEEKQANNLKRVRRETITQTLMHLFLTPLLLLISSITSVITALLYFKTRLAGGESMQDLLSQFENTENQQSNWQKRVRNKLEQSGRVSSNNISQ